VSSDSKDSILVPNESKLVPRNLNPPGTPSKVGPKEHIIYGEQVWELMRAFYEEQCWEYRFGEHMGSLGNNTHQLGAALGTHWERGGNTILFYF
jgi:hypothetical protein